MRQRFLVFTNSHDARRFFLRRDLVRNIIILALVLIACALLAVFAPRCGVIAAPPVTPTQTATIGTTPTPKLVSDETETATWTVIPSPTLAPTDTPTPTPKPVSDTPSSTLTPTETSSPSALTPTASHTPSLSPTPTDTETPTPTQTPIATTVAGRNKITPTTGAGSQTDMLFTIGLLGLILFSFGVALFGASAYRDACERVRAVRYWRK